MISLSFRRFTTFLLVSIFLTQSSWAIDHPLRKSSQLAQPKSEAMLRVTTARVILADYALLKKDFSKLQNMSNDEIDRWLLDHTAYISKPQATQENVNTHINTGQEINAIRPADYGRAAVFFADEGLIDAKGVGSVKPAQLIEKNGLASLGETIREFTYEKLVKKVLQRSSIGVDTVGTYAVIDYGFDIKNADGSHSPAGEVLRQAHDRSTGSSYGGLPSDRVVEIEKVFRTYGITSTGDGHSEAVEKLNIQGTKDANGVVDFGAFLVVKHFDKPARDYDGGPILLDPASPNFVEPDPSVQIPFDLWGYTVTGRDDPHYDNPWVWAHQLADHLRDGTANRADAEQHVRNLLDPVDKIFAAHPVPLDVPRIHRPLKDCNIFSRLDPVPFEARLARLALSERSSNI